jgi:hypothetical protein
MSYVFAFAIDLALSTTVLAATLYLVCEGPDSPFVRGERAASWLRCLGLVLVVGLIGLVPAPYGSLLGAICGFGGIMYLFGLGFWRTVLVAWGDVALGAFAFHAIEHLPLTPWLPVVPLAAAVGLAGWWAWRRARAAAARRAPGREPPLPHRAWYPDHYPRGHARRRTAGRTAGVNGPSTPRDDARSRAERIGPMLQVRSDSIHAGQPEAGPPMGGGG